MFKQLIRGVVDLVYPATCRLCHRLTDSADFCASCRRKLLTDPYPTCPRCCSSVGPHTDVLGGCPHCRDEHFSFTRVFRVGPYDSELRALVVRAKWNEDCAEAAALIFAEGIGCKLAGEQIDVVVGVPLHWHRVWHRKYNQSVLLARALAAKIGVPCWNRSLRRVKPTPPQTGLSGTARRQNVRGAFRAKSRGLHGKSVLLVDDVLTTGATANAAAMALNAAGARQVIVAVMAHG